MSVTFPYNFVLDYVIYYYQFKIVTNNQLKHSLYLNMAWISSSVCVAPYWSRWQECKWSSYGQVTPYNSERRRLDAALIIASIRA